MTNSTDTSTTAGLLVRVLGPVTVERAGVELDVGGPRQQRLLGALALHAGRSVSLDTLLEAVFDGDPPASAVSTFRTYVSRLRRALEDGGAEDALQIVVTTSAGYRLDTDAVDVDSVIAAALHQQATERLRAGEPDAAATLAGRALALWRGQPFGGLAAEHWAAPESARLAELEIALSEVRGRALLDAGIVGDATTLLEGLVVAHPLRESGVRLLVVARYRGGQHAAALAAVRTFREVLGEETGLDPSPELDQLERMVLERDPRLDRTAPGRRARGYVLREVVARSALGLVHRAEQPTIGREVAVTVVPPGRADDPAFVRTFEARAQLLATVEHPNVVPVYDWWREPGGAYLVTRLVDGPSLADRLADGPLSRTRMVEVLSALAGGLAVAHERGVVHGGIETGSVGFDGAGNPYFQGFDLTDVDVDGGPAADLAALADLGALALGLHATPTADAEDPLHAVLGRVVRPGGDPDASGAIGSAAALAAALRPRSSPFREGAAVSADDADAGPAVVVGPNPYRGLAAFRESDEAAFFGRDALTDELDAALRRTGVVALVGPSGSGKSSVVRAGLVPRLRGRGAFVTTMVPGRRPLAELELALARVAAAPTDGLAGELREDPGVLAARVTSLLPDGDGDVVLVVDQAEELLTVADAGERDAFLEALHLSVAGADRRFRLVLTLRADLLAAALEHRRAGGLLRGHSVMVTPMTPEELHEATTAPANAAGMRVEPELAAVVVADAVRSPRSLPMVQFALTELFTAAEAGGEAMTLARYRELGGIEAVLGQRAEEVFGALTLDQQTQARAMFRRLVQIGAGDTATRRRALLGELATVPTEVVDAFGSARLVSFGHDEATREPTVEVTHEALLREWSRLAAWVEAERDDLRVFGHLTVSADEWLAGGRSDDELYRGARLEAAKEFVVDRAAELTGTETAFFAASVEADRRRTETEQRRVSRLRRLVAGLTVAAVAAVGAGGVALVQRGEATARATDAEIAALVQATTTAAELSPALAARLALEAFARDDRPATRSALLTAVNADPRLVGSTFVSTDAVCGTATAGTVGYLLSDEDGWFGQTRRLETNDEVLAEVRFDTPEAPTCVTPDASGQRLLLERAERIEAWDLTTGERLGEVPGRFFSGNAARILPNGEVLVVQPFERTVTRYAFDGLVPIEGSTRQLRYPLEFGISLPKASADGSLLAAVGEARGLVDVVQLVGGDDVVTVEVGPTVELLPLGGSRLVAASTPTGLVLASLDDPADVRRVTTFGAPVDRAGFGLSANPDETVVAVPTSAGLELVDVTSGRLLGTPVRMTTPTVAWWIDERRVIAGGEGIGSLLVDVAATSRLGRTGPTYKGPTTVATRAPDGSGYITIDTLPGAAVWHGPDGETVALEPAGELDPTSGAFGFGASALSGGRSLTVDLTTRMAIVRRGTEVLHEISLAGLPPEVDDLPRPRRINGSQVTATFTDIDGTITAVAVFDVDTGELLGMASFGLEDFVRNTASLGDGDYLVTRADSRVQRLTATGELVWGTPAPGLGRDTLASTADRSLVAWGNANGSIGVADGDTGEALRVLVGPNTGEILSLDFIGDSDRLLAFHTDGSIIVWDAAAGQSEGLLDGSVDAIWRPQVLDGDVLSYATSGGFFREFPLDPQAWFAEVCDNRGSELTVDELRTVVPRAGDPTPTGCAASGSADGA
jgi:DNA-binding SARP family transcriptional activator/energy-coupling factor transporter ATP-binding protein EcfA2